MCNNSQLNSGCDIRNFCSDEQLEQILQELHDSQGVINCTHLQPEQEEEEQYDGNNLAADTTVTVGAAAAAGVATPAIATAGISAAGFTSSGIAAGSFAAATQAGIGNVAAGSLFATLQSVGATGGFAILGPVGIGAAAVVGSGVAGWKYWQKKKRDEERERRQQEKLEKERERRRKIDDGTAEKGVDICEKCWIKMKLRNNKS